MMLRLGSVQRQDPGSLERANLIRKNSQGLGNHLSRFVMDGLDGPPLDASDCFCGNRREVFATFPLLLSKPA